MQRFCDAIVCIENCDATQMFRACKFDIWLVAGAEVFYQLKSAEGKFGENGGYDFVYGQKITRKHRCMSWCVIIV